MLYLLRDCIKFSVLLSLFVLIPFQSAWASDAAEIDREVKVALETLYADSDVAQNMAMEAKGILIFPDVIKAGLICWCTLW